MPLVLLDSFKTHETTAKIIRKYRMHNLTIHTFMQSCHPRIIKASACLLACPLARRANQLPGPTVSPLLLRQPLLARVEGSAS